MRYLVLIIGCSVLFGGCAAETGTYAVGELYDSRRAHLMRLERINSRLEWVMLRFERSKVSFSALSDEFDSLAIRAMGLADQSEELREVLKGVPAATRVWRSGLQESQRSLDSVRARSGDLRVQILSRGSNWRNHEMDAWLDALEIGVSRASSAADALAQLEVQTRPLIRELRADLDNLESSASRLDQAQLMADTVETIRDRTGALAALGTRHVVWLEGSGASESTMERWAEEWAGHRSRLGQILIKPVREFASLTDNMGATAGLPRTSGWDLMVTELAIAGDFKPTKRFGTIGEFLASHPFEAFDAGFAELEALVAMREGRVTAGSEGKEKP